MRAGYVLLLSLLLSATSLMAEEEKSSTEPPPLDQAMEPEVVITPKEQGRVKEYRVNGQLYMIEIIPTKGVPYYLIDMNGDGLFESRRNQLEPNLAVPRWPILRW
jgi:hypothetical protein